MRYFYEEIEQPFYDSVELQEYLLDYGDDSPIRWPLKVYPEKVQYLKLSGQKEASHIAEWLREDHFAAVENDQHHNYCTGQSIVEHWLESYYDGCDWFDGPSKDAMPHIQKAEQIMQDEIDWWLFWNGGLIRMLANCKWWSPGRWCVGAPLWNRQWSRLSWC